MNRGSPVVRRSPNQVGTIEAGWGRLFARRSPHADSGSGAGHVHFFPHGQGGGVLHQPCSTPAGKHGKSAPG